LNPEERRVLSALDSELRHIDQLTRALDLDVSRLSGFLTLLEVRGLVRRAPGMYYSLPES
jgi:DNA processing protein